MYKVIESFKGSPDGCRVLSYTQGDTLEINSNFSEDLAKAALAEGWIELIKKPTTKKPTVKKAVKRGPNTKRS